MPYPALLQRAVPTVARPINRYALSQAEFPREFAEFIDFVGAARSIRKPVKSNGACER